MDSLISGVNILHKALVMISFFILNPAVGSTQEFNQETCLESEARFVEENEEYQKAAQLLERRLKIVSKKDLSWVDYDNIARLNALVGNKDESDTFYRKTIRALEYDLRKEAQESPGIRFNTQLRVAETYRELGRLDYARKHFEKAYEMARELVESESVYTDKLTSIEKTLSNLNSPTKIQLKSKKVTKSPYSTAKFSNEMLEAFCTRSKVKELAKDNHCSTSPGGVSGRFYYILRPNTQKYKSIKQTLVKWNHLEEKVTLDNGLKLKIVQTGCHHHKVNITVYDPKLMAITPESLITILNQISSKGYAVESLIMGLKRQKKIKISEKFKCNEADCFVEKSGNNIVFAYDFAI